MSLTVILLDGLSCEHRLLSPSIPVAVTAAVTLYIGASMFSDGSIQTPAQYYCA